MKIGYIRGSSLDQNTIRQEVIMQEEEITAVEAMKILNMKKSTFYRRVDEKQSALLAKERGQINVVTSLPVTQHTPTVKNDIEKMF